jgi:hypothetical protein
VRIVIGTNGVVRHIRVIQTFPEQWRSIENALRWRFAPYTVDGQPVEVETGLDFVFKPAADANALQGGAINASGPSTVQPRYHLPP